MVLINKFAENQSLPPWASQVVLVVKNLPANAGDAGLITGLGSSPGGGHGNPLQCFCLENSMDRGTWQATVHRVAKTYDTTEVTSHTHTHTHTHTHLLSLSFSLVIHGRGDWGSIRVEGAGVEVQWAHLPSSWSSSRAGCQRPPHPQPSLSLLSLQLHLALWARAPEHPLQVHRPASGAVR